MAKLVVGLKGRWIGREAAEDDDRIWLVEVSDAKDAVSICAQVESAGTGAIMGLRLPMLGEVELLQPGQSG